MAEQFGRGLWEATSPRAPTMGELAENITTDVVIIGGGYTGLSAALHLGQRATKVTLLEGRDIGAGGAGRNVGLVNAGLWLMPDNIVRALGNGYGNRILDVLGRAPELVFSLIERHNIACEPDRNGTLHCAVGEKGFAEINARALQWQRRGAAVNVLNAKATQERTGTSFYHGALLDSRAGTIQPLAYSRGLAQAALDAGASIYTNTPALAVERSADSWIVSTPKGKVRAHWIVVATDAYAHGPWSDIRKEQIHLPYFNFATAPLREAEKTSVLPSRHGCWDTKDILTSLRLDRAGHLIVGSVGALRGPGTTIHQAWAKRTIRTIFPQIKDVRFIYAWYGLIGMTDDSLPRFHKLGPNAVSFSGYNGRGIAPGTMFGRILSDYISGVMSDRDLPLPETPIRQSRFRFLKECFYEIGACVAHLAEARRQPAAKRLSTKTHSS